jgi:hypothetical protein
VPLEPHIRLRNCCCCLVSLRTFKIKSFLKTVLDILKQLSTSTYDYIWMHHEHYHYSFMTHKKSFCLKTSLISSRPTNHD